MEIYQRELDGAFGGFEFKQLTVNALDAHPDELEHRLAAEKVTESVLKELKSQ